MQVLLLYCLGPGSAVGRKRQKMGSNVACTQTFLFFTRTSASSRARRARRTRKKNKELFSIFVSPHHYPPALAVNKSPAVYILSLALDGLWTGYHCPCPPSPNPWPTLACSTIVCAPDQTAMLRRLRHQKALTEKAWKIGKPARQLSGALGWPTERLRELKRLQKFYTDDVHQSPPDWLRKQTTSQKHYLDLGTGGVAKYQLFSQATVLLIVHPQHRKMKKVLRYRNFVINHLATGAKR